MRNGRKNCSCGGQCLSCTHKNQWGDAYGDRTSNYAGCACSGAHSNYAEETIHTNAGEIPAPEPIISERTPFLSINNTYVKIGIAAVLMYAGYKYFIKK